MKQRVGLEPGKPRWRLCWSSSQGVLQAPCTRTLHCSFVGLVLLAEARSLISFFPHLFLWTPAEILQCLVILIGILFFVLFFLSELFWPVGFFPPLHSWEPVGAVLDSTDPRRDQASRGKDTKTQQLCLLWGGDQHQKGSHHPARAAAWAPVPLLPRDKGDRSHLCPLATGLAGVGAKVLKFHFPAFIQSFSVPCVHPFSGSFLLKLISKPRHPLKTSAKTLHIFNFAKNQVITSKEDMTSTHKCIALLLLKYHHIFHHKCYDSGSLKTVRVISKRILHNISSLTQHHGEHLKSAVSCENLIFFLKL